MRYITTDGHSFAYEEDAKEHQQYIDRIKFVDELKESKGMNKHNTIKVNARL